MSIFNEFKKFALRGNMIDLAIGVIIGASFSRVVSSLVSDILMPPIGFFLGGVDFSQLSLMIKEATSTHSAIEVKYGLFLNSLIDFCIIALTTFAVVKGMNKLTSKLHIEGIGDVKCPECCLLIPREAKRCGHCSSQVK